MTGLPKAVRLTAEQTAFLCFSDSPQPTTAPALSARAAAVSPTSRNEGIVTMTLTPQQQRQKDIDIFSALVMQTQQQSGCSREEAVKAVTLKHRDAHRAYLRAINNPVAASLIR
jgi:hypothetical protein